MPGLVYVGTYTRSGRSEGIYVFEHDAPSGALRLRHTVPASDPSFLALHPSGRFLFAVGEGTGLDGGTVASFSVNERGALTELSRQPTGGGEPCHLTTDPSGRWLLVANHEHGSLAVLPIDPDGRLRPMTQLIQHAGSGPGPTQQGPHAHFVTFDPGGQRALVVDKGIDQVVRYRFDGDRLVPDDPPFARVHAGAAPRHLAFHPSHRFAYVNGEADMTVNTLSYPALEELQTLPTVSDGVQPGYSTAQILVEPSGRFVYVSNRGADSIAMFAIDEASGRLTALGQVSTQGKTPRNFAIDPSGKRLYAANQGSDTIVEFTIADDGRLEPTKNVTQVGAPVCILFA